MEDPSLNNDIQKLPRTIQKPKKPISSIWILPIIAAFMGIFLVYKGIIEHPIDVVIKFKTAEGIMEGKTKVLYKGMTIGEVKKISINPDLKSMDVLLEFDANSESILRKESLFWLVTPQINATKITGLDTIMSGNYIRLRPGPGELSHTFTALEGPPPIDENSPGLHLTLTVEEFPSVENGSPVYFKKMEVGSVQSYQMRMEHQDFEIKIHIRPGFTHLVTKASRFWNISGINLEGSFSNFELNIGTLSSILRGGISFRTPDHIQKAAPAENKDHFKLYTNFKASTMGIPIVLRFTDSDGIIPGQTKVQYKGIETGYVHKILALPDLSGVNVHIYMDFRAKPFLGKNTNFWLVKPKVGITGVSGIETLLTGAFIAIEPKKGPLHQQFIALEGPPQKPTGKNMLNITLTADRRGSLKPGSPISFRQVNVGEVKGYELSKTADEVNIYVSIQKKYAPLIRENTRFWVTSGVKFGLFTGLKTESMESVLAGGVAFATPEKDQMGPRAKKGARFILHEKPMQVWLYWKPEINLTL